MSWIPWIGFLLLVFGLLALDLGVLNRNIHEIKTKEAIKWTGFWIGLALLFSVFIYFAYAGHWFGLGHHENSDDLPSTAWMNYISGYLIEKCLSLDNIAVMAMIFGSFRVPLKYQHRVLFWGILGALIMRGIMIGCGAALVSHFTFILWIFGILLIFCAHKATFGGDDDADPQNKFVTKFLKKHFRYDDRIEGMHFLSKIDGKTFITPLLVALCVIEVSDVIFAVDSIPAIFGITQDPFIVFTSNIFAILGLRSLYFVLASILEKFRLLKYSVGLILLFVSFKLLVPAGYYIYDLIQGNVAFDIMHMHPVTTPFVETWPTWSNLLVIGVLIAVGIIGSLIYDKNHPIAKEEGEASESESAKSEAEETKSESDAAESESEETKAEEVKAESESAEPSEA